MDQIHSGASVSHTKVTHLDFGNGAVILEPLILQVAWTKTKAQVFGAYYWMEPGELSIRVTRKLRS